MRSSPLLTGWINCSSELALGAHLLWWPRVTCWSQWSWCLKSVLYLIQSSWLHLPVLFQARFWGTGKWNNMLNIIRFRKKGKYFCPLILKNFWFYYFALKNFTNKELNYPHTIALTGNFNSLPSCTVFKGETWLCWICDLPTLILLWGHGNRSATYYQFSLILYTSTYQVLLL